MNAPQPSQEQWNQIYGFAAQLMQQGVSDETIAYQLMQRGLDQNAAQHVIQQLRQHQKAATVKPTGGGGHSGLANMAIGGVICVIGIAVTVGTLAMAQNGGSYVVAWGAILFGGIQFLRGLGQMVMGN